jgi:tRNA(Ile)-lysidine synthase
LRTADPAEPLSDGEIEALLAPVAGAGTIALAVSGGADSLALLDAVDRWRRGHRRPHTVVLTVDHGLRTGSAAEAAMVVATAEGRGMATRLLTATGLRPRSDIEAVARDARYRLLLGAAREIGASHLLLAHHRDDQAETFLMRLQRGSGVFGLAAMRPVVDSDGLVVFRPFLDIPRSRLVATTAAAALIPVDDPMNSDPRFLRARVRLIMPELAAAGFGAADLAATARRFAAAADAIDAFTDRFIKAAVTVDHLAVARMSRGAFVGEPEEVRLRLLARLLMAMGGERYPPRFERLASLHQALLGFAGGRFKRTLAGAVVEIRGGSLLVYREAGRGGLPVVPLGPRFAGVWDHRFRIDVGGNAPANLVLGPLGEAGRRAIGARFDQIPAAALSVQPAVWRKDRLIAAPTLGMTATGRAAFTLAARQVVGDRLAVPPRFPSYRD